MTPDAALNFPWRKPSGHITLFIAMHASQHVKLNKFVNYKIKLIDLILIVKILTYGSQGIEYLKIVTK